MYAGLASQLTRKLQNAGFSAKQLGSGVLVSLNRQISTMEVQEVVGEHYKLTQVAPNKVMVEE